MDGPFGFSVFFGLKDTLFLPTGNRLPLILKMYMDYNRNGKGFIDKNHKLL